MGVNSKEMPVFAVGDLLEDVGSSAADLRTPFRDLADGGYLVPHLNVACGAALDQQAGARTDGDPTVLDEEVQHRPRLAGAVERPGAAVAGRAKGFKGADGQPLATQAGGQRLAA